MGLDLAVVALVAGPVGLSVLGAGFYFARQRGAPLDEVNDAMDSEADAFAFAEVDNHIMAVDDDEVAEAAPQEAATAPDVSHAFFDDDHHGEDAIAVAEDFALLYAPVHDDHGKHLTLASAVAIADELTPMPAVVHELMALSAQRDCSAQDVAGVIEKDQFIAGALLKLANSAFFGGAQRVDEIAQAVARVGQAQVRELVVGLSVTQATGAGSPESKKLCTQMLSEAACGRVIARNGSDAPSGEAFLSSMFKDMGQVLLMNQLGSCYAEFARAAREANVQLHLAEQSWLGFTHADIGSALAEEWGLSDAIVDSIRFHHDGAGAEASKAEHTAALVRVGMLAEIAAAACADDDVDAADRRVIKSAKRILGMKKRDAADLLDECRQAVFEMGAVVS